MKRPSIIFCFLFSMACVLTAKAQISKPSYHPCFLLDSVDAKLDFIKLNAAKIFVDTFDCRQTLLDTIASKYLAAKETKYLDALAAIRQNQHIDVGNFYTDITKHFIEDDFSGYLNQLFLGKGKYMPLERELVGVLNMIVNGKPLKSKYMGRLNVEIEKARDSKNLPKQSYLEKVKANIESERYN
jgi:hypothetical protein